MRNSLEKWSNLVSDLLTQGQHLGSVLEEIERSLIFIRRTGFTEAVDILVGQRQFVRAMLGETRAVSSFDADDFDAAAFEASLMPGRMVTMVFCYWAIKGQAGFMAGDFDQAAEAFERARPLSWSSPGHIQLLDYHVFSALTVMAVSAPGDAASVGRIEPFRAQLERWSAVNPARLSDKLHLVEAEIARLQGRTDAAAALYEAAIQDAHAQGFSHVEAIACEVASRFYRDRKLPTVERAYLDRARDCYLRWGAAAKVAQLDRDRRRGDGWTTWHPEPPRDARGVAERPDWATVIRGSQALSREIVPPRLIERLMTMVLQSAGADFGLLLLPRQGSLHVHAEARAVGERIDVTLVGELDSEPSYPANLMRYAVRTGESVLLDDASASSSFGDDAYFRTRRPQSILLIPAARQGSLAGVLYLENTLTSHAFTRDRITALEILAEQAAISLEVAFRYQDLQQENAERRQAEASLQQNGAHSRQVVETIPTMAWTISPEGQTDFVNRRWTDYTGMSMQAAMDSGWELAVHPDDLERHRKVWRASLATGEPLEDEVRLRGAPESEQRRFLVRVVPLRDEQGCVLRWYGMAIDIEDRRRAVEELQQLQADFAHAARVVILGEMTASIAHELNQPLAAIVAGGEASVRWLERAEPNVGEALPLARSMIADARRASSILARIRSMLGRQRPSRHTFQLEEVVAESLVFLHFELSSRRVTVLQRNLSPDACVVADRTQLQQVVVNLVMNAMQAVAGVPEADRTITITMSKPGEDTVQCAVEDRGAGVAAEHAPRLFESFFTTKEDGMGMGLAISRSIIEAHGGAIRFDPGPSQGARVVFTLPSAGVAP